MPANKWRCFTALPLYLNKETMSHSPKSDVVQCTSILDKVKMIWVASIPSKDIRQDPGPKK